MTVLQIAVLGPLQVSAGEIPINRFESNKVRALYAYLMVEMDRPHRREFLADMFWPETSTQSALANLRYALADLRKVIGDDKAKPPYLLISRESLQVNAASGYTLDIARFRELIRSDSIEDLRQAVALYRGDFLEGFPSIESDIFEEWVVLKREQFKCQAIEALQALADHHEQRGEYHQALPYARRQVELEPWLEETHQQLMRLLALDGQRSAALAQYENCQRILAEELDVEPMPETVDLYDAILDGKMAKVPLLLKRDAPAPGAPPFKGLQHFDETDTDLFFGREKLVSRLVEQIKSREKSKGLQFIAIIGSSGSGKSSVVRAGLIPALRSAGRSQIVVLTPTEHPSQALSIALEGNFISGRRLLVFVDQFEELFSLCQVGSERRAFIDHLLKLSQDGSILVIVALRADFYAYCAPYENLRGILSRSQEYIGPMNADELRRAIEEPARAGGWILEPGLVDLFLHDIGADGDRPPEPGALPLLSHALLETWYHRSGRTLTLAGYAESGGVHGAITKTAETVFAQFTPEEQSIARNIFLRLTELGEYDQETRRRAPLAELVPAPESSPGLNRSTELVLKMLADARLVTTAESTAEVAHEALIREWSRLREWLAENREGLRVQRHLTESAQEWDRQGRNADLLFRGARLTQTLEWAESYSADLNQMEEDFLLASKSFAEQELTERELHRQKELESARKLAESERQRAEGQTRSARQLRQRATILAGIMLLALALAIAALIQRNIASRQAHLATARELALASVNNLNVDAELSILLALQAISESASANIPVPYEVQDALHRAIQDSRIHYTLTGHAGDVTAVEYSPDGKLLAVAGGDKTAIIYNAETGEELFILRGHTQGIEDIIFSPDGKVLATASNDGTVKLWGGENWKELRTLNVSDGIVWSISFSSDGKLLATAGNKTTKVWDVSTGQLLRTFDGQLAPVAFSPIGKQLATSGDDGTTKIWAVDEENELLSLPYESNTLAFSPDGERLATAMTDLKIWDVLTGEELVSTTGFTAPVTGIEFSPDGSRLATGGQDGTVVLWDSQTGKRLFALTGHAGAINDVAFSPDCVAPPVSPFEWCGVWLATASRDGTAKVWDVSPAGSRELATLPGFSGRFLDDTHLFTNRFVNPDFRELDIQKWTVSSDGKSKSISNIILGSAAPVINGGINPDGTRLVTLAGNNTVRITSTGQELSTFVIDQTEIITSITLNPDGTRVLTGSEDGTAKVWDVATGEKLLTLTGHAGPVTGLAYSPDGTRLATASDDGTGKVWDAETGKDLLTLTGHTMPVYVIAFSPDGRRIATGSMDQTARVWDTASGKNLFTLAGHTASVIAVAFSPDGSRLVTGSHDATARIWDVSDDTQAGQELLTLSGHDGWIDYLSFSPDGRFLAAGSSQDQTIRIYLLDIADLAALARSRLTRSLSPVECQQYFHEAACP